MKATMRLLEGKRGNKFMKLPVEIQSKITDENFQLDEIGLSGSKVCLFPDQVLMMQTCIQGVKC